MQITFGMYLDGTEWSQADSSLGQLAVGPLGFLAWLESHLGLSGREYSPSERIEQYRQKISQANCSWCSKSFDLDSWSTAKKLLSWRDELMQTDWDGKSGSSERLKALAAIEQTSLPLASGIGDRLRRVREHLGDLPSTELTLVEPKELLPPCWQKLVEGLKENAWQVSFPVAAEQSAKDMLESMLKDGRLHVFTENNEFILAEHLAAMLSQPENAARSTLICQGSTYLLDQVLHRYGGGGLGESQRSSAREALCILPLLCEILWEPFSPARMLEFLSSYYCPLKGKTNRLLREALLDKPGIGNEKWKEAWNLASSASETENGAVPEPNNNQASENENLDDARKFIETRFSSDEGIPFRDLKKRCQWLAESLRQQRDQRSVKLALSHTDTLLQILQERDKVARLDLFRILDSIISSGVDSQNIQREVSAYRFHRHPGALTNDADIVIWWNFVDPQDSPQTYWTAAEIPDLGVLPDAKRFQRENFTSHNSIRRAKKLFFFLPSILNGEPVFHHPFMDEINAGLKSVPCNGKQIVSGCAYHWPPDIYQAPKSKVAGLAEAVTNRELMLDNNNITPKNISFTSLNTLLSCPAQWLFKYWARLKEADTLALPTGALLMGGFVHSIIEKLFLKKKSWLPEDAKNEAGELFDTLVLQEAAELVGEDKASAKGRQRDYIQQAVACLCEEIQRRGLTVEYVEKKYPVGSTPISFHDTQLVGTADMILKDKQGKTWIFDLKWSSKVDHYLEQVEDGKALQLATYAHLATDGNCQARCGFFLLPKFVLLENEETQDWSALWQLASNSYQIRMQQIRDGILSMIDPEDENFLPIESSCEYCDYAMLCHFKGKKVEHTKMQKDKQAEKQKQIKDLQIKITSQEKKIAKHREKIASPPKSWGRNTEEKVAGLEIEISLFGRDIANYQAQIADLEGDRNSLLALANKLPTEQLQDQGEVRA